MIAVDDDGESEPQAEPEGLPAEVDAEGVPDEPDPLRDETVLPEGVGIEHIDWSPWYARCPTYGEVWRVVCDGADWVAGYTLSTPPDNKVGKRRLYFEHRLCVPWALVPYVIREHHELGHWGVEKLTLELPRFYRWGPTGRLLRDLIKRLTAECPVCQAHKHPMRDPSVRRREMPVPMAAGDIVALDKFFMPLVKHDGNT